MQDEDVQEKIRQLVRQLVTNTKGGNVKWTDTGLEDAFRAHFKGGMVRVQKTMRIDEAVGEVTDYSLTLLDRNGKELEDYYPPALTPEDDLANLWILARRSARSTVDVLENLLKEVSSGSTTGR